LNEGGWGAGGGHDDITGWRLDGLQEVSASRAMELNIEGCLGWMGIGAGRRGC